MDKIPREVIKYVIYPYCDNDTKLYLRYYKIVTGKSHYDFHFVIYVHEKINNLAELMIVRSILRSGRNGFLCDIHVEIENCKTLYERICFLVNSKKKYLE
jgi:hypothetical protein